MPGIPLRGLFPPNGQRYELFECSVLVVALSFCWYIATGPSEMTSRALFGFLDIRNPQLWGTAVGLIGVVGIVASYWQRTLQAGYLIVTVGISFWGLLLLGGAFTVGGSKTFGVALVFFWIARRLVHESGDHE